MCGRKNTSRLASVRVQRVHAASRLKLKKMLVIFLKKIFGGVPVSTGARRPDKRAVAPDHHKTGN